jgi:MFS family permease
MTFNNAANTTVQLAAAPEMRGRVMGVYMLVFTGGTPIGGPLIGWITETYGARVGLVVGGGVAALAAAAVGGILYRTRHTAPPARLPDAVEAPAAHRA